MSSLLPSTLLFLRSGNKLLLAMKKRGFGKGRWNGVGGKPEGDESIEQTAIRECQEEIDVTPVKLKQVAMLDFYFPKDKADWNQRVSVYMCDTWQGDPVETEEMKPQWCDLADIPYDAMWTDDKFWLPHVWEGKFVTAEFHFDDNDNILKQKVSSETI